MSDNDLKIAKEKFEILNCLPISQFILRSDKVVLFWNKQLENVTGIRKSDIEGKNIEEKYPDLFKGPLLEMRLKTVFEDDVQVILSSQLHKHFLPIMDDRGSLKSQETSINPIYPYEDKDIIWALISMQDVTEYLNNLSEYRNMKEVAVREAEYRKEVQGDLNQLLEKSWKMSENLNLQKELLESVNKELDSFVYTASHDLRAPLRGISSFATFLKSGYQDKLDEKGVHYLNRISMGVQRMTQLIDDLLALSRISRQKNPFEVTNINDLLKAVLDRIEFDIQEHNVDIIIQKNIPEVNCDRIKMTEVFLNLINNGIKFSSKENSGNPKIEVGYEDDGEYHRFLVKDNGIGIEPQYHEQIFGIFKRLHDVSEYEGTGAGLSIVKRVIDDHQGRIWIESELGKGAAFCFTIPKDVEKKHKKLGEILVEDGFICEEKLKEELGKQEGYQEGPPEYKEKQ